MPSRRGPRQIVGILPHAELITMVLLGMVRNAVNWFHFTWNGNVQNVWNLPGPEPSFTVKYHFDYWLKNVLSLVVLFRNFTTHLHLLFYIVMLYPLLTGERPRLMLPWLYLQMAKNIVTDVICTVAGVLLCWTLHSCGLLTLEFLVVRIISMMPSIYLWRRLRSYYFDLYYSELDGVSSFPVIKAKQGRTLAQRRRATKSLDGTMPIIASSENRTRFNSSLTYDEFFGPANWEASTEKMVSKSLTTLLTIESQESDDVGEDSSLQIIDNENMTPAEKTLKILGLTREEVDAAALQIQKTTSTTDLGKSEALSLEPFSADEDLKSLCFSVMGETVERRGVKVQVRIPDFSKSTASSKEQKETAPLKKCECCEKTKCSKENETDSDDEEPASTSQLKSGKNLRNVEDRVVREIPMDCCDQNRKGKVKPSDLQNSNKKKDDDNAGKNRKTVLKTSEYCKNDFYPRSCPEAVEKRDGIAWENLKEINFVSVINKALCNETKPFKLPKDAEDPKKSIRETFKNIFEDTRKKLKLQSDRDTKEIIPEHEDGTKFIHRLQESSYLELAAFSGPTSASFGAESDILVTNASFVFEKTPNSEAESFDSMVGTPKQVIQPDHDTEFDSYFKSSFKRHSKMFDDSRAQLEPFQGKAHSDNYRVNENLRYYQTEENPVQEKNDASYDSLGLYRSRCNTPQYRPDSYEGRDSGRGNLTGNEFDVVRDVPDITESKGSENQRIISASKNSAMTISKPNNSSAIIVNKRSTGSKSSRQRSPKDRRSLASSSKMSRSSKVREMLEERDTKEMQALRAYNEKTLVKYKKEMAARNREDGVQNKFSFYVPSVPELEKPERELILNIEKAYAKFARSKPVNLVSSEALHGNCEAKDFLEIYSGNGRLKKDSRKIKVGDKTGTRKQHSKYSKLSVGTKEADVTSGSCRLVEGSQKGRELERTLAKENIRAENVEVYFLERQIDDKPSTSKNPPIITTIKSFSRKNDPDLLSAASSETITPRGTQSPMIEVLDNPEEIPCRIDDSEYYRQLRKKNLPQNVKEAVKNIDWSFRRPTSIGSNRRQEKRSNDNSIARVDMSSESRNIVLKTTEDTLRSIFANSDNSARGFRLGESANEFYPIFNTVSVAMEEIIRAAALRGFPDEFISQPATEIEVPEIGDGNLYGLGNLSSGPRRGSSSGFIRCSILPEENRTAEKRSEIEELPSITTSAAPEFQDKKRESHPLDQDESPSTEDEEATSLLGKLISQTEPRSAEVNIEEGVPKEAEDFCTKKPSFPSRSRSLDRSLEIGQKPKEISSEGVRSALHNIIFQSPKKKLSNKDDSRIESPVVHCGGILDRFDARAQDLRSIVFEFFEQFPNCVTSIRNGDSNAAMSLKGSEFVPQLQMLTNLYAIQTKVGEIMSASEEPSSNTGNPSFEQEDHPERPTTQTGTNFENVTRNTSTEDDHFLETDDRDKGEKCSGQKMEGEVSSLDKFGKPRDEDKRLLSSILEPDSMTMTDSELLNRANFRHQVISSGFAQAIKQRSSFSNSVEGTEAEILAPEDEDRKVENEVFASNHEELLEIKSRNLAEAEMLELWITDDEEQPTSRTALVCPMDKVFLVDSDNAASDILLRDIETAECAIKRMKTIFEQFLARGQSQEEKCVKYETSPEIKSKVSSLTNSRFPLDEELRKLQNLVQTVANYVTIARSSSTKSIKSLNEPLESHVHRKELNAGCRTESSDNIQEVSETSSKNGLKSNTDDSQTTRFSLAKTRSSLKSSEGPESVKDQVGHFSSWDKVIPLSTKRQIAKSSRKTRLKKMVAVREPARRVVKVLKPNEKKSVEFFGARSVPQRGRGLSSGYLMDSDSDGNFTVSRPPTPVSLESERSLTLLGENEQPGVFPKPLEASEIFAMSDKSQSRTTNRPVETSWSTSSEKRMKDTFLSKSGTNLDEASDGEVKSLPIQESLEISCSLLITHAEAPLMEDAVQPTMCDEEMHVLGDESLSTASDLQLMTPVDAAGIENKLKDVVQQILSHQFRGVNPLISEFGIGSKNSSLTSIPDCTRIESSADLQPKDRSPEDDAKEEQQVRQDCQKKIQELLHKSEGVSSQQLNIHYRSSDSTSRNSDVVSFEVTPRKSGVSARSVATGTEYNIEVFKDLLDMFEKIHSIGEKSTSRQTSKSCGVENGNDTGGEEREITEVNSGMANLEKIAGEVQPAVENYEMITTSYDSFISVFSRNTSEASGQAMSLSNHTYFEDFPEQVDSSFQFSPKICEVASLVSGESVKSENSNPSGSQSNNDSKKDASPKKKGIPRPVKRSKERK